ncbi:retrovirus-related Pol polyprotein from type-1 retrotransposable element R1 2 isoform X1 [Hylaeus anthracinus]|uniref:retrovirus-related Pol polyprotein from type-1 retrotransposable element R1 2 isoform X1 n=1 Tax=Hylaeus anthracinus TaxID=313031 RepID=UPI0023B897C6|nr:retrovirus-related Pol polyprotein from type-1 retrotransposable element R1 2 isoform X1 [Hylaeus anthracinus]
MGERIENKLIFYQKTGRLFPQDSIPKSRIIDIFRHIHEIQEANTVIIYSDGSKIPTSQSNRIGLVVVKNGERTIEGIAISALQNINENFKEIVDNPWTYKTWKLANRKNTRKLIIGRIPRHINIIGNELAEQKAKRQTERVHDTQYKVPAKDILVDLKEEFWNKFKEKGMEIGREKEALFMREIGPNHKRARYKPWFIKYKNKLDRSTVRMISRIRCNHYNLRASLAWKGIVEDSTCPCGQEDEDIDHVLFECGLYNVERNIM